MVTLPSFLNELLESPSFYFLGMYISEESESHARLIDWLVGWLTFTLEEAIASCVLIVYQHGLTHYKAWTSLYHPPIFYIHTTQEQY